MKIIDNFLPDYQFKQVEKVLMSNQIPWYYGPSLESPLYKGKKARYQFTHVFFAQEHGGNKTYFFDVIEPCLVALRVSYLRKVKCNLNPRTLFHRWNDYHIDFKNLPVAKTAVYYINTNNGYTKFQKGGKVKSVANRMVIFDSDQYHRGVTCTDQDERVVVNFNYESN
jgi:hypothetical protein